MVHCQDRNSSSLGCPANKNSPCADVPGKKLQASPHMFTEKALTMTGKDIL